MCIYNPVPCKYHNTVCAYNPALYQYQYQHSMCIQPNSLIQCVLTIQFPIYQYQHSVCIQPNSLPMSIQCVFTIQFPIYQYQHSVCIQPNSLIQCVLTNQFPTIINTETNVQVDSCFRLISTIECSALNRRVAQRKKKGHSSN